MFLGISKFDLLLPEKKNKEKEKKKYKKDCEEREETYKNYIKERRQY